MAQDKIQSSRPAALNWLTVLRYPAALWVVLIHCEWKFSDIGYLEDSWLKLFFERGYLGVSFFFMLSGFILVWNYPSIDSKRNYLAARAARILPVYYLSLLFTVPLLLLSIFKEGFYPSLLIKPLMFLALLQSWYPKISDWWNGPAWTLSCEAFFYVSLIATLPFLTRLLNSSRKRALLFLSLVFALGLIAPALFVFHFRADVYFSHFMSAVDPSTNNAKIFIERFPLLRVLEFIGGAALCIGFRKIIPLPPSRSLPLIFIGLMWIVGTMFLPFILSMGTWTLPGFAMIILGASSLPFPSRESTPVAIALGSYAVLLGNASYAVYLFHEPIRDYLLIVDRRWLHLLPTESWAFVGWLSFFVATLSTVAGVILFVTYEEPARRTIKKILSGQLSISFEKIRIPLFPGVKSDPS